MSQLQSPVRPTAAPTEPDTLLIELDDEQLVMIVGGLGPVGGWGFAALSTGPVGGW